MTRAPVTAAAELAEAWPLPGADPRLGLALRIARQVLRAGALLWWAGVALDAWSGRQPWWAPVLAGLCLAAWLRLTRGPLMHFGTQQRTLVWHPGNPGQPPGAAANAGRQRAQAAGFFDEQGLPVRVDVVLDTGAHLLLRLTSLGQAAGLADHRWVPPRQLPSVWRWRLLHAARQGAQAPASLVRPGHPPSAGIAARSPASREVASLAHLHANTPSLSSTLQSPTPMRAAPPGRPA